MKTRLFVFGCSLTSYSYATWADIASANFDEYYNYGRSGGSNTFIMNRVVEANEKFHFNSETDTVMIMLTGIGRFSYAPQSSNRWVTNGDIMSYAYSNNDKIMIHFIENMWGENWAVYQSWIAVKTIKQLLTSLSIPHEILMGISFDSYLTENEFVNKESVNRVCEILSHIDVRVPLQQWTNKQSQLTKHPDDVTPYWVVDKRPDGHPSQEYHYKFLKTFCPKYDTIQSKERFDFVESIFDNSSQHVQGGNFDNNFSKKYNSAQQFPLFGDY